MVEGGVSVWRGYMLVDFPRFFNCTVQSWLIAYLTSCEVYVLNDSIIVILFFFLIRICPLTD